MKILLPTCDKYQFLVENIIFNFSKYWPEHFDVVILGHSEPKFSLPNKWSFIQLAEKSSPKDCLGLPWTPAFSSTTVQGFYTDSNKLQRGQVSRVCTWLSHRGFQGVGH